MNDKKKRKCPSIYIYEWNCFIEIIDVVNE
jgi:hypothetical protein